MKTLAITIPIPPRELSPNGDRAHWSKVSRAKNKQKGDAMIAAMVAAGRSDLNPCKTATLEITAYHKQKRNRDGDNLIASLKGAFDGLEDAGVIEDDSGFQIQPPVFEIDRENPRIELKITPLT